jgi:hypothetical protein
VRAFERTDRQVIYRMHNAFEMGIGAVSRVGACALVALIRQNDLYIANGRQGKARLRWC